MTETLAHGYSYESTQRELSGEYQHDRVWMVVKNLCVFVLWTKVASALEGLKLSSHNSLLTTKTHRVLIFLDRKLSYCFEGQEVTLWKRA